jgi:hypothetical protein
MQRHIASYIREGLLNKEIAWILGTSSCAVVEQHNCTYGKFRKHPNNGNRILLAIYSNGS